jgi:hypothetical protein
MTVATRMTIGGLLLAAAAASSIAWLSKPAPAEPPRGDDYFTLADTARAELAAGEVDLAEQSANELLALARADGHSWNYGNAVHDGHLVLGLVAVERGDLARARHELLASGATPGSPQLDSFGPNMLLAKALLERGDDATVLQYFAQCRRFWETDFGALDTWTADVRAHGMPDFRANLLY